jgi:hypothetical protein
MKHNTIGIEVGLVFKYSSSFLCEVHEVPDIVVRGDHLNFGNRFFDVDVCSRLREVFRIGYIEICVYLSISELTTTSLSSNIIVICYIDESSDISRVSDNLRMCARIVCSLVSLDENLVCHLWARDDDVHIMFAPEPLLYDVEMQ